MTTTTTHTATLTDVEEYGRPQTNCSCGWSSRYESGGWHHEEHRPLTQRDHAERHLDRVHTRLQIGDGVTLRYPQDTYGFVVVAVSKSGRNVTLERMPHPADLGHQPERMDGPYPVWSHTYTEEERARVLAAWRPSGEDRHATLRNDGCYRMVGDTGRTGLVTGTAHYHRNHSY